MSAVVMNLASWESELAGKESRCCQAFKRPSNAELVNVCVIHICSVEG
jgi:hypothetical protein